MILDKTPAEVVQQYLINAALAVDPDVSSDDWPVYVSIEPETPDNCITLFNTAGIPQGRLHTSGEHAEIYGLQVRVRSNSHADAQTKIEAIKNDFDVNVNKTLVTLNSKNYTLHSISRRGPAIDLGTDKPSGKRRIFVLNCTVTLQQTT